MSKAASGYFFEDFSVGMTFRHAAPAAGKPELLDHVPASQLRASEVLELERFPILTWATGSQRLEVLAREELFGRSDIGALRLVAGNNADSVADQVLRRVASGEHCYDPRVVLDLDYWGLIPRRG